MQYFFTAKTASRFSTFYCQTVFSREPEGSTPASRSFRQPTTNVANYVLCSVTVRFCPYKCHCYKLLSFSQEAIFPLVDGHRDVSGSSSSRNNTCVDAKISTHVQSQQRCISCLYAIIVMFSAINF